MKFSPMYHILALGDELVGSTEPRECWIGGVAKRYDGSAKHVVNELICNRIGLSLGLPIPPGEIAVDENDDIHYVSLFFGLVGETPPPADLEVVAQQYPELACGIVAFDVLVGNDDRHAENLAYDPENKIDLVVFDHSEAMFGPFGDGQRILQRMDVLHHEKMILAEEIREPKYFHKWFDLIEKLPIGLLDLPLDRIVAYGLLSDDEAKAAIAFLQYRKDNLRSWLTSYGQAKYGNWSII